MNLLLGIYLGGALICSVLSMVGPREHRAGGLVLAWLWPVALPAVIMTKLTGSEGEL